MLEGLVGNATAEKVLLFLEQYEEGYALEIAKQFDGLPVSMVQRQLQRLEAGGILVSQLRGLAPQQRSNRVSLVVTYFQHGPTVWNYALNPRDEAPVNGQAVHAAVE